MLRSLVAFFLAVGLAACAQLPLPENRSVSTALSNTGTTRLGRAVAPGVAANPGKSGIHPLLDAHDAFAARVLLARAAERSLDVQYYIWHQDLSGTLLFAALHDAADRGVRVRLLLDDINTSGLDPTLAALDAHPNLEVRLFNPFAVRSPRLLGYLSDFSRLNRRMHNKSFTADNQLTIVGGRNVGDEYFGATDGVAFVDLDVVAAGPVVQDVSQQFDRYWASASSYPVDRVLPPAGPDAVASLQAAAARVELDPAAAAYLDAVRRSTLVQSLLDGQLEQQWATTRLVSDDPAKGLGQADERTLLARRMAEVIGEPATELALVSPYFVPGSEGVDAFAALAGRGVKVRILTNSLEANDVAPVHAGYAKRRQALLEAGVGLYELRRLSPRTAGGNGSGGSSASSLHAKTFAVDRSRVFVGSFNFDPRSVHLNTEMGVIIDSPPLAQVIATAFDSTIPANAYEVRLSEQGQLVWLERRGGDTVQHTTEPGTKAWQRGLINLMSVLPIEWLL